MVKQMVSHQRRGRPKHSRGLLMVKTYRLKVSVVKAIARKARLLGITQEQMVEVYHE